MLIVARFIGWLVPIGALLARKTPLTARLKVDAGRFRVKLIFWRLVRTRFVWKEYSTGGENSGRTVHGLYLHGSVDDSGETQDDGCGVLAAGRTGLV